MVKLFVWGSMIFLLGSIAVITYLTFGGNYKRVDQVSELQANKLIYANKDGNGIVYSIKYLDSITAADNYFFTKANACDHPFRSYK